MPGKFRLKVVHFEAHPLLREGFAYLVRSSGMGLVVAGEPAVDGLRELVRRYRPNLIAVNQDLLRDGAFASTAEALAGEESIALLVLASKHEERKQRRHRGVLVHMVCQKADSSALLDALTQIAKTLDGEQADINENAPTGREAAVLHLISSGLQPKEIARKLDVQPKTVYAHIANLKGKTGSSSIAQLALWTQRRSEELLAEWTSSSAPMT